MNAIRRELRRDPSSWLLALVPVVLAAERLRPEAPTVLVLPSVAAIIPFAALLTACLLPGRRRTSP